MLMILRLRLKGLVSSPVLCPALFSSEAPTRDDRGHWPSSVCLSFLDLSSACRSTASASARLIFWSARSQSCGPRRVAIQQAFNPPPTCFTVRLLSLLSQVPTPRTTFTETQLFEVCSAKVGSSLLCFPSAPLLGNEALSPPGLSIPT